jgi:hydrogenase maturation protease
MDSTGTVIAGFGSPHGDDQVGWRVIELLCQRPALPARCVAMSDASQLIDQLDGCRKLSIVDACRTGDGVGSLTRLTWPDPRIAERHSHSTHGIGVCGALWLAERLGRLPHDVEVFGIEVGECEPGYAMTIAVQQAAQELAALISAELCEVVDA